MHVPADDLWGRQGLVQQLDMVIRYFACTHDVVGDVIRALLGAGADMEATTNVIA